jgi:C-terminal processing protease CtpA/Prc
LFGPRELGEQQHVGGAKVRPRQAVAEVSRATVRRFAGVALALCIALALQPAQAQPSSTAFIGPQQRAEDFAAMCRFVEREYAYLDARATDWPRVCERDAPLAARADTRSAFIAVLERSLGELYDHHAHLGTANDDSPRLVPTGSLLRAQWRGGRARVIDVRPGSSAEAAGVKAGDEIVAINGTATAHAIAAQAPRHLRRDDAQAQAWALHVALAGARDRRVALTLRDARGTVRELSLDAPRLDEQRPPLAVRIAGGVAHLRIHNALGDDALIAAFDTAIAALRRTQAVVLDLRDTPSGGNSTVARAVMGHFVERAMPYQRHDAVGEQRSTGVRRVWTECVAPRAPHGIAGKHHAGGLVVLVGGWTGSMGEGIAIGLHAAARAEVVGRPMAGLLGALGSLQLVHSGITVRIPTERLHHVDGTPREAFVPKPLPRPARADASADPELDAAIEWAKRPRPQRALDDAAARSCATEPVGGNRPQPQRLRPPLKEG